MPFGLCNAPSTFQRALENALGDIVGKFCEIFIDDILVYSETFQEHLDHLWAVFTKLKEAGFKLKPQKCYFAQAEVGYLGHVLSAEGIRPDPKKVELIKYFPAPTDLRSLRGFLGLVGYYRRFVQNFAKSPRPYISCSKRMKSTTGMKTVKRRFANYVITLWSLRF